MTTLRVGQVWENRTGDQVRIIRQSLDRSYPFEDREGRLYTLRGKYVLTGDSDKDLVKLVYDVPSEDVADVPPGPATLRDEFAMAALQGLCANPGGPFQRCEQSGWTLVNCTVDQVAQQAYELADAMLSAREVQS